MKQLPLLSLVLALAVGACANSTSMMSPGADDVTADGAAGVHQLSVRYPADHAGTLIAQSQALTRARTMCESSGQAFMPLAEQAAPREGSDSAEYSLLFRCIAHSDGLRRQPTVNAPPEPPL